LAKIKWTTNWSLSPQELNQNSVRVSKDEELSEQFRAFLAIVVLEKPAFNKMVKESKKKAVDGEINELEIEIGSNKLDDLDDFEKKILKSINGQQRALLRSSQLSANDDLQKFIKIAIQSSISVLNFLDERLSS
jgi:hypothetical protein